MNTTNPYLAPPPPTTTQPTRPSTLTLLPPSSTSSLFPTPTSSFNSLFNTPTSTPIVITPNTLKTIEQSILQTLGEDTEESFLMESQQYSGNFVPPLPSNTNTITLINTWQGGQVSSECDGEEPKPEIEQEQMVIKAKAEEEVKEEGGKKKRAPAKKTPTPRQPKQKKSPATTTPSQPKQRQPKAPKSRETEEDERRRIRRERNKLAAARCRKRRVDHTNQLLQETEGLESKKRALQNQITELQSQKEELEFILEAHTCVKKVIKNEVLADLQNLPRVSEANSGGAGGGKLKRPTSLNVVTSSEAPIPISTPSNGIAGLGFDSLCSDLGVTGYTPIEEANVPESGKGSLVTPVNPYVNFKKLQDL